MPTAQIAAAVDLLQSMETFASTSRNPGQTCGTLRTVVSFVLNGYQTGIAPQQSKILAGFGKRTKEDVPHVTLVYVSRVAIAACPFAMFRWHLLLLLLPPIFTSENKVPFGSAYPSLSAQCNSVQTHVSVFASR